MVFSSTVFLFVFLPISLLLYYNPFFKGRRFKNIVLLFASLIFYAWGEPLNIFLMIFSIVLGWEIGRKIQNEDNLNIRKMWLSAGIIVFVLIFFVFKYLSFVTDQICILTGKNTGIINIALPIGISFYLFQIMSYLFDVYYRKAKAQDSILNVGLYVSLFPQLIAGPIVRYSDIMDEIEGRKENISDFSQGIMRFSWGLGKKVLLANYFGVVADDIFAMGSSISLGTAWLGAIAYTMQIFFDFSGYSDMAIGLGRMFGFHFLENFVYPYIADSVTDFWRRWHISLSSWLRDYVYIPLGGNRVSTVKWVRNLFVVWFITGIWHGANWTFLLWGILYFFVLLAEKGLMKHIKKIPLVIRHFYTMIIVVVAWVIFRSDTVKQAFSYIRSMFSIGNDGIIDSTAIYFARSSAVVIILGMFFSTSIPGMVITKLKEHNLFFLVTLLNICVFIVSVIVCVSSTYNPFIYFNF